MRRVELAIVGGGPAGLSTALHLLQRDRRWADRMVLLEKAAHPRHKLCAGGITQFGLRQLSQLGLSPQVPYIPVERARISYHSRSFTVHGEPLFIVTRREEFDAWLASEATSRGLQLLENHTLRRLERFEGGVRIETPDSSFEARAVVGADGARGSVRRWIGEQPRRSRVARLLEVVHPASGQEIEYQRRQARFDFSSMRHDLQGYYWDFPSLISGAPYMNSGVYDSRLDHDGDRADLPSLLTAGLGRAPEHLEGHPIHWFAPDNAVSNHGVLLVGDAAGAEPLFGEGIGIALGYGAVAAETIQRAYERQSYAFRDYRRRLLLSPVGKYLLLRWIGAQALYHARRRDSLVKLLWWMGRLAAGWTSPKGALPPLRGAT